ncbi:MAG: hypothetical protein N3H84_07395 [Candidatus Caldarchaeum sp.]|nr:hypothetical protein [Candidatus Caldarchaeum sp.]
MDEAFHRASFYVSLHVLLKSYAEKTEPPHEIKAFFEGMGVELASVNEVSAEYLADVSASDLRKDLPFIARQHLPSHIKSFIEQSGYTPPDSAEKLLNMTAYAARLAIDAYNDHLRGEHAYHYEKILLRFLHTHLLPALQNLNTTDENLNKIIAQLVRLLQIDRAKLFARFLPGKETALHPITRWT